MNQDKIINKEKRKNVVNKVKNDIIIKGDKANKCNFNKYGVSIFAWVKTLISVHDAIPNIIKLIDKMVAAKAASAIEGSSIFGDYQHGTFNQVEKLLDMQERKLSLLNVYAIIENMVASLPKKYREFVSLKYYKHKKMQYVSDSLEIDERTAFRWSNLILNKLVEFCEKNNWTEIFFISQTKSEPWIKDHYNKYLKRMMDYNRV